MEQRYEIVERIATGGMAEIYRARVYGAGGFEKPVVVKKILPAFTRDREFVEMFIEEAKLAGTLQHGNIVQVYDLGVADGEYFIVMEYVHGRDLGDLMHYAGQRGIQVDVREAIYIVQQICTGLDYAHRKVGADGEPLGIIHRDISPQNVILSYEGEVKLTDLGIAKAKTRVARTQVGFLKGKYGYMSPEQARAGTLDHRSDIYNVGILLFELLVGERLFLGSSDFSTLNMMRNGAVTPLRELKPGLPDELEAIVHKALAARPADRFQTAGEMERALSRFSFQRSLVATASDVARLMARVFGEPRKAPKTPKGTRVIALSALPSGPGPRKRPSRPETVALGPVTPPRWPNEPSPPPSPPPTPEIPAPEGELETDPEPVVDAHDRPLADGPAAADAVASPGRPSTFVQRPEAPRARRQPARRMGISPLAVAAAWIACAAIPFAATAWALWPEPEEARAVLREAETERIGRFAEPAAARERARAAHAPDALLWVDADAPDASVWIDGERADGRTPLLLAVRPGEEMEVTVAEPDHGRWSGRARVAEDARVVRVAADLGPPTAELRVFSRPSGATVQVEGEPVGTTPLLVDALPRGAVRLRVVAPEHAPWEGRIDLTKPTERIEIRLIPEARAGRLEIVSVTQPVSVRVDGSPTVTLDGEETVTVAPGLRSVRVESPCGIASRTYRVDVPAGRLVRLFVDLQGDAGG